MQVLRGAFVIDGTGAPGREADVVIDGDRIIAVEDAGSVTGAVVVDLTGLVLAPGFIDCHTHYDAQILWDPDLTPSSWHGVTTVVMGNCGFGLAPTRPEHRATIARTLENVEGMSIDALTAGITWDFESFPEYLDVVDALPKRLNVGALIGHTPLRLFVMGADAVERAATEAEVAEMQVLVGEALDAGALGFATSKHPGHAGDGGRPVPSVQATVEEIAAIADELGRRNRGVLQATRGPDLFVEEFSQIATRIGRPVTWTALNAGQADLPPFETLAWQQSLPGEVYPQVACRPIVAQVTLADPAPFARAAAFQEVLAVPHDRREAMYRDPAWRNRARADLGAQWGHRYDRISVAETEQHPELVDGPNLAELAAARGVDPLDVLCDISLDDGLRTRFRVVLNNHDEVQLAEMLLEPGLLLALSDAGAHASQLCDACWSTHLLEHWVRKQEVLSLEQAVWRLTGHPAQVFRIEGRGRIAAGYAADLVAFDAEVVGIEPPERVWDLPGGADRLLVQSKGIEASWVNGTLIRENGKDLVDVRPGALIRGGGA